MVAGPLAMSAAMAELLWWTWPVLIIGIWWWADRSWRRTWIVGVEAGIFGAQWTIAGALALGDFPGARLLIGTVWISSALALAGVSAYNRCQNGPSPTYPGD